jgi:hypothetical protein
LIALGFGDPKRDAPVESKVFCALFFKKALLALPSSSVAANVIPQLRSGLTP